MVAWIMGKYNDYKGEEGKLLGLWQSLDLRCGAVTRQHKFARTHYIVQCFGIVECKPPHFKSCVLLFSYCFKCASSSQYFMKYVAFVEGVPSRVKGPQVMDHFRV